MSVGLLVCRLVLAGVFVTAGLAKLADLAGSRQAVVEFGVPQRLAATAGVLLPLFELAVAVALVPVVSARFGALAAVVLLIVFVASIANAMAHGRAPDCHCFGQVHSAPAGWPTLARNSVLLGVAGFVTVGGWRSGGLSATHWLTLVSTSWLVVIAAGLLIVGLVAFQVWFSMQLLSQNGRTLGRLEAVEAMLVGLTDRLGIAHNSAVDSGPLGYGLSGGGLAVGSRAPQFELESVDGGRYSLASLLSGRRLLLLFTDAGCGPCTALMPEIARWQREHDRRLEIVLVASGDQDANRAKAAEHGLQRVLLQGGREVADAYQAHGTPMAVVVSPAGVVESPTVGGSEAITTLVAQATRPAFAIQQVPSGNANRNGSDRRPLRSPDSSRVGEAAPELTIASLHGEPIALGDLYIEPIVAIFWNPGCGFCQRMLADLRAFEDEPPTGAPRLVVISSGDPGRIREQEIRSLVLMDPEGAAMSAFGAGGTPMGVLVQGGRIASPVAAGADAVFALISSRLTGALSNGSSR
jgi:methylamine dehydrogenase accessory protein MauD